MDALAAEDEYGHEIPNVMYVVHNVPGPGVDVEEFESEYSACCDCTTDCLNCFCTRGAPNYVEGKIKKLSGPIIECNAHCSCGPTCGNRIVQMGPVDSLAVAKCGDKGLGLVTSKFIRNGQFICEYAGEAIGLDEAYVRVQANKRENSMNYVLVASEHIGDRIITTCIDPKYFGNIGRYCNHSCEPSAMLIPVRVEGPVPRLCLFARRDIEPDQEITFNYAGEANNFVQNHSDTLCLCRSINCSGYLPHDPI